MGGEKEDALPMAWGVVILPEGRLGREGNTDTAVIVETSSDSVMENGATLKELDHDIRYDSLPPCPLLSLLGQLRRA